MSASTGDVISADKSYCDLHIDASCIGGTLHVVESHETARGSRRAVGGIRKLENQGAILVTMSHLPENVTLPNCAKLRYP